MTEDQSVQHGISVAPVAAHLHPHLFIPQVPLCYTNTELSIPVCTGHPEPPGRGRLPSVPPKAVPALSSSGALPIQFVRGSLELTSHRHRLSREMPDFGQCCGCFSFWEVTFCSMCSDKALWSQLPGELGQRPRQASALRLPLQGRVSGTAWSQGGGGTQQSPIPGFKSSPGVCSVAAARSCGLRLGAGRRQHHHVLGSRP